MVTASLHINRDIILATKRQYMQERQRKHLPMEAVLSLSQMQQAPRYMLDQVHDTGRAALIAQVTRTPLYDPVSAALRCVHGGADAISFFTDHAMYNYDLDDMFIVARAIKHVPIIYQNYALDEYGVLAARAADASAMVAYASILTPSMLRRVVSLAQRCKMTTLLQITEDHHLDHVQALSPHALCWGDNLSQNVERALNQLSRIRQHIPSYTKVMLMVCLQTLQEVKLAVEARMDAVIVSEELFKSPVTAEKLRELVVYP